MCSEAGVPGLFLGRERGLPENERSVGGLVVSPGAPAARL